MIIEHPVDKRTLKTISLVSDFVVVGGGLSGICAAIAAARQGLKVILIQDRPVLGGNASSEVRLWVLGATSHMGNNNRWAREGGIIDEILVENTFRNKEGNPNIFDTILLEKVVEEPNIRLLLNTAVFESQQENDLIKSITAFCSQNATLYTLTAPLFCDASGDGILGFLAGAAFRMGAESKDEYGEAFAPDETYGELLGHTIYFYSKDTGRPVKYVPPSYALKDITQIPRFRNFNAKDFGCRLWWLEYGGRKDTVHETEEIKWELWKVVHGVWNHIKNSGKFPEAENLTLEWVGTIPGKRESRRFEGDYMLIQQDIIEQRKHKDSVAYGGWSVDLHPSDGVYSEKSGCNQWHSKGIYGIPFRCYYSKNINNLFLAGRIISASHVAFGSSRVMATCAHGAQAVGMAAAICKQHSILPRSVYQNQSHLEQLQQLLIKETQHIPDIAFKDNANKLNIATVEVSSSLSLKQTFPSDLWKTLEFSSAQMLPLSKGKAPKMKLQIEASQDTALETRLSISSKIHNHTPDIVLKEKSISVKKGVQTIELDFDVEIDEPRYAFYALMKNEHIKVRYSEERITGILTVFNKFNKAVSNEGKQNPPAHIGIDAFEFWTPERRPDGQNFAFELDFALLAFEPENLKTSIARPVEKTNAWVADKTDQNPCITIGWDEPQTVEEILLSFDTDFDHPMETSLMGHPENSMPFCVNAFEIWADGALLTTVEDHHQSTWRLKIQKRSVKGLKINMFQNKTNISISLFRIWIE